jgi:hypothetical protein
MSSDKMIDRSTSTTIDFLPSFLTMVWLSLFFTGHCSTCDGNTDYVQQIIDQGASDE